MKQARYTGEQMVRILREADLSPVAAVAKKHGVSEPTICAWRKRFGSLETMDVRRVKTVEQENARLKKLLAERDLEIGDEGDHAVKILGVPERRRAVAHLVSRGLSQRRSCALIGVARSTLGYESVIAAKDAPVVSAMKALAAQYPRYGYRRIRIFLRREGHAMSPDRCHRLWQQAALQVPRKRPRRRVTARSDRPQPPASRNHVWAYDFVFDACANDQQLKCLAIIDEYTRECLAIDVAGSIRSRRVIDVLARLITIHGAPRYMRSDNGPEFVSRAILDWIVTSGINTAISHPGKPWQNGTDESFNGKLRDECLSMEWFRSREEAKMIIETWRRHYNAVRPHSSLDYLTPNEFKAALKHSTQQGASL